MRWMQLLQQLWWNQSAGGEGSIIGTIIGALIIGVLRNGANLLNISEFVQRIVIGVIIIVAVIYDRKRREKSFSQE